MKREKNSNITFAQNYFQEMIIWKNIYKRFIKNVSQKISNNYLIETLCRLSPHKNDLVSKMDKEKLLHKYDFCEKLFFNEDILGIHIESVHKSIIKGFKKCNICESSFACRISLLKHINSHQETTNEQQSNKEMWHL